MKTVKQIEITPIYCDYIPNELKQNEIYISELFHVSVHLCLCGCGLESVLPIIENGWTFRKSCYNNNETISISPSILNKCGAHYVINENIANILDS